MGDYLTTQDVARQLEVTVDTVRRWLRAGRLKGRLLGRAGYRIEEKDLYRFMQEQQATPSAYSTPSIPAHPELKTTMSSQHQLPVPIDYEQLLALSQDAIIIRDSMSTIISWNEGAASLYGWPAQDVQGKITHMLLQTRFPTTREDVDVHLIQYNHWKGDLRHTCRDGHQITVESHQQLIRDEQDRPALILEINHDITRYKQAEEVNLQFAALFENSTDFIALTSLDGTVRYLNQAARTLIGIHNLDEIQDQQPLKIFLPEQLHEYYTEIIEPQVKTLGRWEGDIQLLNPQTGETIDVHQATFMVTHPQTNSPMCIATIAHDIREQKELEQRKDAFISMASHELRNPLTTIHANLQLAERRVRNVLTPGEGTAPPETFQKATRDAQLMIQRALRQTKVMNRLIGDLLDGTRIQANKLNLSLSEYDIISIVNDVVEDQREVSPQRSIRLEIHDPSPISVLADRDRIGQVVGNYLTNALKYSPSNKEVVVGITSNEHQVRVWVSDCGPGLTLEQQEHIWDRYYQARGVAAQSGSGVGLGLGLHISKTLINRHGGEVGVDSIPEAGSTFWFTLPLAEALGYN